MFCIISNFELHFQGQEDMKFVRVTNFNLLYLFSIFGIFEFSLILALREFWKTFTFRSSPNGKFSIMQNELRNSKSQMAQQKQNLEAFGIKGNLGSGVPNSAKFL